MASAGAKEFGNWLSKFKSFGTQQPAKTKLTVQPVRLNSPAPKVARDQSETDQKGMGGFYGSDDFDCLAVAPGQKQLLGFDEGTATAAVKNQQFPSKIRLRDDQFEDGGIDEPVIKKKRDFFEALPLEVLSNIFEPLPAEDLNNFEQCSSTCLQSVEELGSWYQKGCERFANIGFYGHHSFADPCPSIFKVPNEGRFYKCTRTCCKTRDTKKRKQTVLKGIDWKARYMHFHRNHLSFREPDNKALVGTRRRDYVAYLQSSLMNSEEGVYCEVDVVANPDNLSLSVVDYEDGGDMSSITFSPDTGAVIREKKENDNPRLVYGTYFQPLATLPSPFVGRIGLYLQNGWLAFYRKETNSEKWETTQFITKIDGALNLKLDGQTPASVTPCLAFRDFGDYFCKVSKICKDPPIKPITAKNIIWKNLTWDADAANQMN